MSRIIPIILISLTVLFLLVTVFAVGVYSYDWDKSSTGQAILKVIPLPAAVVDGELILIDDVNEMAEAFQKAVSYHTDFDFISAGGMENVREQKIQILNSLIENKLIEQIAEEAGIRISASETDQYYEYLLPRFGIDRSNAVAQIRAIFGWSEREFKQKIVKPDLLRSLVQISLLETAREPAAKSQIEFIQTELNRGVDFAFMARELSDDESSRYLGGDLGFFSETGSETMSETGLAPWFRDKVFSLDEGEVSDIIVSPEGYHLFKALFRDDEVKPPEVQLAHILIKDNPFSELLEERISAAAIYIQR